MRMTQASLAGRRPIDAYGDGGFRIAGAFVKGDLLMLPSGATGWAGARLDTLAGDHFAPVIEAAAEIEILLVGTGSDIRPLPASLRAGLEAKGLSVEVMSTGAAARTYNVLLAENRRVAAALIAVD